MAPRFQAGFDSYDDHPGHQGSDDDPEDGSAESEESDEEAAALARIRDRSTSRRGPDKRGAPGQGQSQGQAATAAKRQKFEETSVEADNWVCCDRCNKWRLLRKDVFLRTVREDEPWFCEYNYGRPGASCTDMDDEKAQALGQAAPVAPAAHTLQSAVPLNRPGAALAAAGLAHHMAPGLGQRAVGPLGAAGYSGPVPGAAYLAQQAHAPAAQQPYAQPVAQLPGFFQSQPGFASAAARPNLLSALQMAPTTQHQQFDLAGAVHGAARPLDGTPPAAVNPSSGPTAPVAAPLAGAVAIEQTAKIPAPVSPAAPALETQSNGIPEAKPNPSEAPTSVEPAPAPAESEAAAKPVVAPVESVPSGDKPPIASVPTEAAEPAP